jgi:hypothetical protein
LTGELRRRKERRESLAKIAKNAKKNQRFNFPELNSPNIEFFFPTLAILAILARDFRLRFPSAAT